MFKTIFPTFDGLKNLDMVRLSKMRVSPLVRENLNVALRSLRNNRLRSALTILMIAIGITSLIGILTATESFKNKVSASFEQVGASSFYITRRYRASGSEGRVRNKNIISYFQAMSFKERFSDKATVTVYTEYGPASVERGGKSTSPNIWIDLADENFAAFNNYTIANGRDLNEKDIRSGGFVCILGTTIVSNLFAKGEDPIGENVTIGGVSYSVIGVLEDTGNARFDRGVGNTVILPVTNGRARFLSESASFDIGIRPKSSVSDIKSFYEEAEQVFRSVRRLSPTDKSDFSLDFNESMVSEVNDTMRILTISGVCIGLITLLSAAVGLMNIMLVSVKERTSEIGVRKAIGASARLIRQQFLFESIVIAEIGCIIGVVIGILMGNAVAVLLECDFLIPWIWMIVASVICMIVGVASGYIPAKRAADLDPIEALRYE